MLQNLENLSQYVFEFLKMSNVSYQILFQQT